MTHHSALSNVFLPHPPKLAGRRASVRLKICPGRDTILGATGIPVVEEWLVARGFAIGDDRTLMASA